jgi:hypothetical protein
MRVDGGMWDLAASLEESSVAGTRGDAAVVRDIP